MPAATLKYFKKKTGYSLKKIESDWEKYKEKLKESGLKEGDPSFYPILIKILKNKYHIDD